MSWKTFQFFQKELIDSGQENEYIPLSTLLQGLTITCICPGLFLGDHNGNVHMIDKHLQTILTFKAYPKKITFISYVKEKSVLITVGEDEQLIPTLQVWQIDSTPVLIRSTKITLGSKVFPVTAIAYLDNLTQVAIGLENGVVIVIRGDLSRDRFTKSKVILEGSDSITGLGYRDDQFLFITTTKQILIYDGKDVRAIEFIDSEIGSCILTPPKQEMVVARPEAVYFYGPEGKGPCFILDGEKSLVTWYQGYLVMVTKESRKSELLEQVQLQSQPRQCGTLLSIIDLQNKYIAFKDDFGTRMFDTMASKAIGEPIRHVFADWGDLFVITESNKLFRLREADLALKLDSCFQKKLYTLAMNIVLQPPSKLNVGRGRNVQELIEKVLADKQDPSWTTLVDICKRFGDDLYSRSDFDQAMKQYIRTIGYLEPSFVIRKFLDAQRIHNLTGYLKALHDKQVANGDHTTLLLNCYTKLNDLDHLNEFIDISDSFDAQTALIVCRNSGYHQQALRIASKFDQHDWFIKILIDDLNQFDQAISYLQHVPETLFKTVILKYGYILVSERPEKMVRVLLEHSELDIPIQDILAFFVSQPGWCVHFLEELLQKKFGISTDSETIHEPNGEVKEICDNLLEMQLALRQTRRGLPHKEVHWDEKILGFLKSPSIQLDLENALFLCKQYAFSKGELVLFEKLELYEECLDHHIKHHDFESALKICILYGKQKKSLWLKTVAYSAAITTEREEPNGKLIQALNEIEKSKVMTHAEIIQMLSGMDSITLGMVRPFLLNAVSADMNLIKKVFLINQTRKQIENYQSETDKIHSTLQELEQGSITFQSTKCELCRQPLELPTMYFLCKHAYHTKCLGDLTHECPRCGPEHRLIEEMLKTQRQQSGMHDLFFRKLDETAGDPYAFIVDSFAKHML